MNPPGDPLANPPTEETGPRELAISKRLRFEIFRRDNHACRYCGTSAPNVKLTIDHVVPVALGGTDEPGNLATACADCNSGKSAASPDAATVADVSADALRWGRAMAQAARILEREYQDRVDLHRQFHEAWDAWTYDYKEPKTFPLPSDWRKSVDSFLAAGLPMAVLTECVDLAMAAKHIRSDGLFRYMCGIAWRKVAELREIAGSLLEADQES